MSNDNSPKQVAPDTDDLDAFDNLFHGEAEVAKPEKTKEPADEPEDTDDQHEDEDLAPGDDSAEDVEENVEDDSEEDDGPDEEEDKAPKQKKQTAQERINELTAARRQAERDAEIARQQSQRLEARLAELERRLEKPSDDTSAQQQESSGSDDRPHPDAVDDNGKPVYPLGQFDPDYINDLARYSVSKQTEEATAEQKKSAEQQEIEQAQQQLQLEWQKKLPAAEQKYENFAESVGALENTFAGIDPNYGQHLATIIMSSDYGPDILYELSQDISQAQSIVDSGATAATLAIGRLEAKYAAEAAAAEKKEKVKVTKAPEPPKKRTRGNGVGSKVSADTDDLDAFESLYYEDD